MKTLRERGNLDPVLDFSGDSFSFSGHLSESGRPTVGNGTRVGPETFKLQCIPSPAWPRESPGHVHVACFISVVTPGYCLPATVLVVVCIFVSLVLTRVSLILNKNHFIEHLASSSMSFH